jgi:uncharacterized oxidoreductase
VKGLAVEIKGNVVLVTGGASGIGLALAQRFLVAGSRGIICGRREAWLKTAAEKYPGLVTRKCNLALAEERIALATWVVREFPELNVLVNNAGIQRWQELTPEAWDSTHEEIAINFEAPVHLSLLLLSHLRAQARATIVNVGSGLALVPLARVPVYSATKAALHSFTISLRHQLAGTGVRVVEILPPAVNTDLGGPGLHTFGVPLDPFADAIMTRLEADESEIAYGTSEVSARAAQAAFSDAFARMNAPRPGT